MKTIVLNHLDKPLTFFGLPLKSMLFLLGGLFCGAIFDSFLAMTGGVLGTLFVLKTMKKFPKFFLMRFVYRQFPTKKLFKKHANTLLESHISEWVK